jgi:outer membrane immunogenic protein
VQRPLLFAFGVVALSATLGIAARAAEMPLKAPPAAPAWSWSGIYLGGHAGYAWGHDPASQPLLLGQSTPSLTDVNSQGALAGFQVGANWQRGAWLMGLEFDISATAAIGSSSAFGAGTLANGNGVGALSITAGDRIDMLGSGRARLGYLVRPDLLLYATGGLAWSQVDVTSDSSQTGALPSTFASTVGTWRYGWVGGAGAEMRLANTDWLARLEYLHYDFGDATTLAATSITNGVVGTASVSRSGPLTVDLVRVGLSYKFGGGWPIVAAAGSGPYASARFSAAASSTPWSWTGVYVGGHAGYGWGHDPLNEAIGAGVTLPGVDAQGGLAGFQAGANWQRGRFVGGLEIDLSATDIRGQSSGSASSTSFGFTSSSSVTIDEEYRLLGSARARLGYLVSPTTLLYSTGGLGWTDLNQSVGSVQSTVGPINASGTSNGSQSSFRFGWVAGLGAEQRIGTTNWIGRLEYLHYDFGVFGRETFTSTPAGGVTAVTPVLDAGRTTADVVRVGASYRLGSGDGAPSAWADATPVATNWNGFYLGIHGGGGFGNDPIREIGDTLPLSDIHSAGWLAGGQAGANWQVGRWLAGLETDLTATGIKGSTSASAVVAGTPTTGNIGEKFNLLGSARARLGWLPSPNLLVYGTGGLAWTQITKASFSESVAFGITSTTDLSQATWMWGWVAGLGAETRIGQTNWLGRIEYLHYDFGRAGVASSSSTFSTFTTIEGHLTADVLRAGLSYQLN